MNLLPRYVEENVKFDNLGNVLMTTDNQVVFPLLWVFGNHVKPDKNKLFVIEVELLDTESLDTLMLRYISLTKFTPTVYPKLYAGIFSLITSKRYPINLVQGQTFMCDEF